MDPRIRQRDIIMREEFSAERMRMNDSRYINLHLSTPGYRQYRPAWKMIAWHVTAGDDKQQNQRKQSVLDSLTDAQKQANTTRGSTPGLIDPTLGDVPDNRVPIPDLRLRKHGAKRAVVHGNEYLAAQPAQVPQAPPAPPVLRASQTTPDFQQSQALYQDQIQQTQQPSRANSSYVAIAPAHVASATTGPSFQRLDHSVAAPVIHTPTLNLNTWTRADLAFEVQSDIGGHVNTQARDMAAMPPPPFPLQSQIGRSIQRQAPRSNPGSRSSTNQLPNFDNIRAEVASMDAESERAMAEILSICEPFIDPCAGLPGPPPIVLSAELVESLGMGC